jgi:nitrite reductase/ring-hydroxylating ferredoxin subunit
MHEQHLKSATLVKIAHLDQIAPGGMTKVATAVATIALFNLGGRIFALDDPCVRCGRSLAEGTLRGNEVSCPGCDWRYDVTNGCVNGIPALRTETFEVTVVDACIMLAGVPPPECAA